MFFNDQHQSQIEGIKTKLCLLSATRWMDGKTSPMDYCKSINHHQAMVDPSIDGSQLVDK